MKTNKATAPAANPNHGQGERPIENIAVGKGTDDPAQRLDEPIGLITGRTGTDRAFALKRVLVPVWISGHIASFRNRRLRRSCSV